MDKNYVITKFRVFLEDECGVDAGKLTSDDALFSSSLLNSLDILRVVSYLEETFTIQIGTWEVSLEGFDTMNQISEFVLAKLQG